VTGRHTTYIPLVRFRSPRPLSLWVTALLAVLDSAALYLALSPGSAPAVPARLCLRCGFVCFREVAQAMGFTVPDEPDPGGQITLSYQEFLDAVERLRGVDFPIERDPEAAWPDRRLAGHLRAGGVRGGGRGRRCPSPVVRLPPNWRCGHPARPADRRPPAEGT